jgi:hypothetical protein
MCSPPAAAIALPLPHHTVIVAEAEEPVPHGAAAQN